jgi:hypothetical protein
MKQATLVNGLRVVREDLTGPRVAHAGSTGQRVLHAGSMGPHEVLEEAQAEASWPRMERAMVQGRVSRVEVEPDRTQRGCRDRSVGRRQ